MDRKRPKPRLTSPAEKDMTAEQRSLRDSIASGPRGVFKPSGPFAIWMHAPAFGQLAQQLGAHCRYKTSLSPRQSEFAILTTARYWRAQYEWQAHEPQAEKAGVKTSTIRDIRAGKRPAKAPADERAIYDFVTEMFRTKRVSDRAYKPVLKHLGNAGTVELVGILGYYSMIGMMLNVFQAAVDPNRPMPFREPSTA
jgi:4-carboxymuconolactone decarboxylase